MISVVVPVFNGAHILATTVPAVLASRGVSEIVWVDDGSTDETRTLLARWAAADDRARVVTLPTNRGRAAARNVGVASTSGSVVVFFDADVEPGPDAAQALGAAAREPGAVASVARLDHVADQPAEPFQDYLVWHPRGIDPEILAGSSIPWRYFLTGACAVRRSALDDVGGFDEHIGYGEDLALGCALRQISADGLRLASAVVRLHDLGDLVRGLVHAEALGRSLPLLRRRCPGVLPAIPGAETVAPLAAPVLARVVRTLPMGRLRRRAVRYLLAATALRAARRA